MGRFLIEWVEDDGQRYYRTINGKKTAVHTRAYINTARILSDARRSGVFNVYYAHRKGAAKHINNYVQPIYSVRIIRNGSKNRYLYKLHSSTPARPAGQVVEVSEDGRIIGEVLDGPRS